jgi:hypothetical protein
MFIIFLKIDCFKSSFQVAYICNFLQKRYTICFFLERFIARSLCICVHIENAKVAEDLVVTDDVEFWGAPMKNEQASLEVSWALRCCNICRVILLSWYVYINVNIQILEHC